MGSANLPQPIHAITGVKLNGILSYFNSFNKKITSNKFQKPLLIKFDCHSKVPKASRTAGYPPTNPNFPESGFWKTNFIHSSKLL
jgi:hypothetical protein